MMTLVDLTTAEGLQQLVTVTGGTQSFYNHPDRIQGMAQVAKNAIAANPDMAHLKVRIMPNLPNAFYNYDRGEILLGIVNPDALAHELGHAHNIKQEGLYRKILNAANSVARANNFIALPAMLALRMFVKDPQKRDDILQSLAAVSLAIATPGLLEEASASINAMKNAPDKLQAAKTLGPAFLAHAATSAMPTAIYEAGRL